MGNNLWEKNTQKSTIHCLHIIKFLFEFIHRKRIIVSSYCCRRRDQIGVLEIQHQNHMYRV